MSFTEELFDHTLESIEYYSTGDEKINTDAIDDDLNNMIKQYDACINGLITDKDTNIHQGLFYLESQQYKTGIGNIDILAREKYSDNYTKESV